MYLDNDGLNSLYKDKDNIFEYKSELGSRFDNIDEIFEWILKDEQKVEIDNDSVKIGNVELTNKSNEGKLSVGIFGPAIDNMTRDRKLDGILAQVNVFGKEKDSEEAKILLMMGGFDFKTKIVTDKYRILSSKLIGPDYAGSVTSVGQSSWVNSHFSDNTYYFQFMKFVQESKETNDISEHNIALAYPIDRKERGRTSGEKVELNKLANEPKSQRDLLKIRFPLKFLWMWANKDKVIHPFSLMAFRNFVDSKLMEEILNSDEVKEVNDNKELTAEKLTDMEITDFMRVWLIISEQIIKKIQDSEVDKKDLSKLISILMVEELDIKNAVNLLQTSKQIILYGAPGTGKTYMAMNIVKEFIKCNKPENEQSNENNEFENKYRFSKKSNNNLSTNESPIKNLENGLYEIVQFHPNYTYQDFIGGISPKIKENEGIGYELKEGIFQTFCKTAQNNPKCNFIFIIDEINRANLSEVFGELLYALEYRGKSVNIPDFGEFVIPENVYIIGTMNNVDKSLVTFDLALRRRFGFFHVETDFNALAIILKEKKNVDSYIDRCEWLNRVIINKPNENEKLREYTLDLEPTYQIGQAYFLKIKNFMKINEDKINEDKINPNHLTPLWTYHLEPLLEEYLGMSLESSEIKKKLEAIKKEFIKDLPEEQN